MPPKVSVLSNEVGGGGRRKEAAPADDKTADVVGRRDADRRLDRLAIEEASVAANHKGHAGEAFKSSRKSTG